MENTTPDPKRRWTTWQLCLSGAALALVTGAVAAYLGSPDDVALVAPGTFILRLLRCGWLPGAYLLGAWGYGRIAARLARQAGWGPALTLGVGLGVLLTLSHACAWAGLWSLGPRGILPLLVLAPGLMSAAVGLRAGGRAECWTLPASRWWLALAPAFGLLLVCACVPPGWLWRSEKGGYDALSYHLQLPQEWLAMGRLAPLNHNVYSFLPGSIESAFLHLATLAGVSGSIAPEDFGAGFLARSGQVIFASQLLHALLAMAACLAIADACRRVLARVGIEQATAGFAAIAAAGLAAWTPWTLVVGSLAYNEMALVLLFACAIAASVREDLSPTARWVLCALLVGAACGCKPTALTFCGLPVGVLLLAHTPRPAWLRGLAMGAVVGAIMIAPWMTRNAVASGNPVFPFAAEVFQNKEGGTGHWSKEQVQRWKAAHHASGSLTQKARLMVTPDTSNPQRPEHRGLLHPQWYAFFPLALAGIAASLWLNRASARAVATTGLFGGLLLVQIALWLLTTHVQSRFLLPLMPVATVVIALGLSAIPASSWREGVAAVVVVLQGLATYNTLASQPAGQPLRPLFIGTGMFTGEPLFEQSANGRIADEDKLDAEILLNLRFPTSERILLLGDATPLYLRGTTGYATTWDTHPLAAAITADPDEPAAWSAWLREAGYEMVLVNFAELHRLERSGFLDPRLAERHVSRWADEACVTVAHWPERAKALLRPLRAEELQRLLEQLEQARQRATPAPQPVPPPETAAPPR